MKKLFLSMIVAAMLLFAGCASQTNQTGNSQSDFPTIECGVAYRSSPTEPVEEIQSIQLAPGSMDRTVSYRDLTLRVRYDVSEFESTTFIVDVLPTGNDQYLVRNFYQLPFEQALANQFEGGHGFSGLVYVQHPETQSELQYACSAKDG